MRRKPSTPVSNNQRFMTFDRADHARIVEVQVGLMREEPVPVELAGFGIPGQFDFSVSVKMIRVSRYFWSVSLQTCQLRALSRLRPDRCGARLNQSCWSEV